MRSRGFTLIEMLVVIAIIVILAGLLMPAIHLARSFARKVAAKSEIENIAAAWQHYYSEYQRWPSFVTAETPIAIADGAADALSGGTFGPDNPRRIKFASFNRFNTSTNPITPWGSPAVDDTDTPGKHRYWVMFDANFDNTIDLTPIGAPLTGSVRAPLIVWTFNDDVEPGSDKWVIGSWQE